MIRASSILLYLGLGLATQVVGYGDTTFRSLISADASLSVWAHILAWPLFLLLLCGYYLLWFFGVAFGIAIAFVAYLAADDFMAKRARAKLRKNGNVRTAK